MNAISLADLVNGLQVVAVFCGSLLSIFAFFHFALVKPMKAFLRREIVENLVEINKTLQDNTTKLDEHIANGGHNHGNPLQ